MKKIITLLLICTLSTSIALAQNTLIGTITNKEKQALENIDVSIIGQNIGTTTNKEGSFEIKNIKNGTFQILINNVGYESVIKDITFANGEAKLLNLELKESIQSLQEVEIIGREAATYKTELSHAMRMSIPIRNTPVSINTVTKELIKDLNITSLDDVVKNTPGVVSNGGFDKFKIRGFNSNNYFLYNGAKLERSYWSPVRLPNIERVELLMGASSALFGNAAPGGSINLVTKKPLERNRNFIKFTTGSFETHRAEGDFTGPVGNNKKLFYRLNTAYERSNGQFIASQSNSLFIAPSITFKPNKNTNVNVELTIDQFNGIMGGETPVRKFDIQKTPSNFSITQPSDYGRNIRTSYSATLSHKFSEDLSLVAMYLGSSYTSNLSEHSIWNTISETKYSLQYTKWDAINNSTSFSTFLRGQYDLNDDIEFNPILGVDLYTNKYTSSYLVSIGESDGVLPFDTEQPEFSIRATSKYKRNGLSNNLNDDTRLKSNIGLYFQGHLKFYNKLNVLFNTRLEKYIGSSTFIRKNSPDKESTRETISDVFIPRLAINYEIVKNLNIFTNYSHGFEPVPNYFQPLKGQEGAFTMPMTSVTYETGVKAGLFNNRLAATLSLYHIPRKNVVVRSLQDRTKQKLRDEISRGIEFAANGNIKHNWNLSLTYAYNHIKVTKDPEEGVIIKGMPVQNVGKQDIAAPFFLAGLFSKYKITNGPIRGISFGLGGNYVSARRSSFPGFIYPSYVIANANLYYKINQFEIGLICNNIMNTKYVKSGYGTNLYFGRPRTLNFSVGYTF